MPQITLPDGSIRQFDHPVSLGEIAQTIGSGLARAALAGRVNNRLVDLSHVISEEASIQIITSRDPEGPDIIRHSTAHLLGQAVKELYPEAQVTIGPVIENGFYYDFAYPRSFHPEDLLAIEDRMRELVKQDIPIQRREVGRNEAISLFRSLGEGYKAKIIEDIPEGETLSLYKQGNFVDLCRGPHVPNTGKLGAFKLTKLAGAFWRGDSRNEMLQRIYGTAWPDQKALNTYLHQLEEAEKRDHRKLGKQLDLFHFQEEAPGMVFWHDKGYTLYRIIENYIRNQLRDAGYQEVMTPQILDCSLWERSGHYAKFHEEMFTTRSENREYAIKPMNCPGHIQIFNQGLKSYRDLPLRIAEFGTVHRNEPSGTLHGLMRARRFVQDDAHVFCTERQIESEVAVLIDLTFRVYQDFGFNAVELAFSTRPENRVGDDVLWDKAEAALEQCLRDSGHLYRHQPGEGAFYGPKIEFSLKDSIGRIWQCGTIQLDFSMPSRLGAEYVTETSERQVPVMIHRAILGSMERFIGILIEHHEGKFPFWLAPRQAVVLNISEHQADYAGEICSRLQKMGYRVNSDLRNEKIGFKIREHTLQRVPYLMVVGDREVQGRTVSVRTRAGDNIGSYSLDGLHALFLEQAAPSFVNCFGG